MFSNHGEFATLDVAGRQVNSFVLLSAVLECGGMQNVTESQWIDVARSVGMEAPSSTVLHALKTHYSAEFGAFEK